MEIIQLNRASISEFTITNASCRREKEEREKRESQEGQRVGEVIMATLNELKDGKEKTRTFGMTFFNFDSTACSRKWKRNCGNVFAKENLQR